MPHLPFRLSSRLLVFVPWHCYVVHRSTNVVSEILLRDCAWRFFGMFRLYLYSLKVPPLSLSCMPNSSSIRLVRQRSLGCVISGDERSVRHLRFVCREGLLVHVLQHCLVFPGLEILSSVVQQFGGSLGCVSVFSLRPGTVCLIAVCVFLQLSL